MVNLTPYQILVLAMLALWLIPLMLVWARFDRFPHGRELLAVVMLSPLLLTEQTLSAFEISANWHFLVAVFISLPLLLTSLLSVAITRLLLDPARYSAKMILLPGGIAVLASIPFLFYSLDYKSGLLAEAPVGDLTQHWYLYGYMLLCQGVSCGRLSWWKNGSQTISCSSVIRWWILTSIASRRPSRLLGA
ncbi:hypothetical protein [Lacimicrobium alkaliphilum]|uniref:Uncharacterized protein n=1 Tax=Lacimicrobium alkaliphilum TaxID=1526571 RepID=A0A0U2QPD8_9ALTE|nr:hypothetical protein [Lacimicrobium alkaliphilum]ALS99515.1 hypothetical protein AT746_15440 [Lacimicrobium alkaliphilum]